jgi:hypothetical protein
MLETLKNKILHINKALGLEIVLLPDGSFLINAIILNLEKNKLIKQNEFDFLKKYDDLAQKAGLNLPLSLTVTGKGVLIKKVAIDDLTTNPIELLLPAANPDDFYFEVSKYQDFAFVTIIRKETLDGIVENLIKKGFKILDVSLGITNFQNIMPFFNFEDNSTVVCGSYSVKIKDLQVLDISSIETNESEPTGIEYNIGDQYVRSSGIIPFASATGLLANGIETGMAISQPMISKERENYKYFKFFKAALIALLVGVFAILLINFIFYNYYFEKNKDLQTAQLVTREQMGKTSLMAEQLNKKEQFLTNSGWDSPSRLSFLADKIGAMVPLDIQLTEMKIYPVAVNDFFDNTAVSFKRDTIVVNGTCGDPSELSEFTSNLRNTSVFNTITIQNYTFKKETNTGVFLLEITTK